ncbi:MAG: hypothetical protein IT209_09050 [Armatimonadetes bacterium]|nr:hypothetical protein [Armatimonadota bacterium]
MILFRARKAKTTAFCFLLVAMAGSAALAQQWAIVLDSQPRRIAADGRSTTQISARVSSPETGPAPDGTEVRFNTTSGSIVPIGRVTGGRASTILTSAATRNIAQVTAIVGSFSATTEVEFVSGDFQAEEVMLTVEGDLAYSADRGVLIGADATLRHGDLTLSGRTLEFDEQKGQVRAQDNVTISKRGVSISADAVFYSPEEGSGALLVNGREPQEIHFRADTLTVQSAQPATDTSRWTAFTAPDTRTWITADKAVVWPRERIQFTQATVAVNGKPVLALPHYFYDYRGNGFNPISQQFRYTTYEGMVVDLPFYFQFEEQSSAGIRLRYAGRGTSYGSYASPRKGFSLGLEQIYNAQGGGGRLFVDSFASSSRLLEWSHNQSLSGGRTLNGSLRFQPHSGFAKNAISGFGSYGWRMGGMDMTLAAYGSRSQAISNQYIPTSGSGSLTTRLDARSPGRPIGDTGLSWRTNFALVNGPLYASKTGSSVHGLYQTLGIGISNRPIHLAGGTTLTLDTDIGRTFGALNSNSVRGKAVLAKSLGRTGEISLTWDQQFAGGGTLTSAYRKALTGTISAGRADGLHGYAYLTWLPDEHTKAIQATVMKPLSPVMRLEISHNFSGVTYDDGLGQIFASDFGYTRFSLVRALGIVDLSLNFSPQGRDYGLKRGQKIWFELGSRAF